LQAMEEILPFFLFFYRSQFNISQNDFEKGCSNQSFPAFRMWGTLGWAPPRSFHKFCMSPLLRNYIVLCLAPNGPVHPTSARKKFTGLHKDLL
jgi:hypothetical protein